MMDSDDEHESQATALTGFLFGNIDEEGKLVDDVLDEESKRHLGRLSAMGIGSMVEEITAGEEDSANSDGDVSQDVLKKSESAVDFSDIMEVAEEPGVEEEYKTAMANMVVPKTEGDDYDGEDGKDVGLMPPPAWIPPHSQPPTSQVGGGPPFENRSKLNTPLAGLLPPELADKDVRQWFPEFRPGQVLRFSRLFKSHHKPQIWKKKKKPKASDTLPSKAVQPSDDGTGVTDVTDVKVEPLPDEAGDRLQMDTSQEEEEEDVIYVPFALPTPRDARPEEIMLDDAVRMVQPDSDDTKDKSDGASTDKQNKPKIADWRYGPAQLWYDMLGVEETGEDFDYGFRLKTEDVESEDEEKDQRESELPPYDEKVTYPDDAFSMVTQLHWEDDVIWNADDVRQNILSNMKKTGAAAGWIPSSSCRTLAQYIQQTSDKPGAAMPQGPSHYPRPGMSHPGAPIVVHPEQADRKPEQWFSIFPVENESLLYDRWEDDIIWDAKAMDRIPSPKMLTLDLNDDNIILKMPDDKDPDDLSDKPTTVKEKKEVKRSRVLLGKAGIIKDGEDEEEEDDEETQNRDPFNLSNDDYYNPRLATDNALRTNTGGTLIQHSIPAVELRQPYFPTHISQLKLRQFHRVPLKRYSYGPVSTVGPHPVHPLLKNIKRKQKAREQERLASGGGDMFFMRTPEDLTGRDGDLILAEYSEEFPSLLMRIGMATKIKNYFKRKPGKDSNPPEFKYGELAYAHTSPFLGAMTPGQCLPAFENNMFRAPVYQHKMPVTDFLVIRTRQQFYIREVEDIITVGQECPLYEVPGPNSKKANNFQRDYLQVYIYRKFWSNKDDPRRIKMEEIKKAFPLHSESSIRKRLKLCADFKRTGVDSNWWVQKPDFRLPTEDEMRAMVSPEQCCAFYSLLAAEQRLKDAGYGEKTLFAVDDDIDDDTTQVKIDDEVRAAPWNTTHSYIQAMKGKCLLALTGVADPTGCGEGFSYVKVPNKPSQGKKEEKSKDDEKLNTPPKKTVTGTDADLRRLPLKDAKNMLRKFGVAEADIKKLSRWEVIDVVRTMSTEQAKAGSDEKGLMSKFARGNRFSVAEHQERYKEECQRVFDLQNKILASDEVLSTDDEDTEEEDSDFEEMSKNIDSMLLNKKTSSQVSFEREEQERKELQKMLEEGAKKDKKKEEVQHNIPNGVRKLKITRTFRNDDGKEYMRTEIVRKPAVIEVYMKIRQTKDASFIRQFAALEESQKEEMKKERRRIQEQLRRIKRNQAREKTHLPKLTKKQRKELAKEESNRLLKCGACGGTGHMRTNKECPVYAKTEEELNYQKRGRKPLHKPSVQVAITEEQEEEFSKAAGLDDTELVKVEGTKMKLSKELLSHAHILKKKALTLKIPKAMAESKRRRRAGTIIHCDYLRKPSRVAHRRRADPMVTMSTIFENIINEMRDYPAHDTTPFQHPVNAKHVPDYYRIVKNPISLQVIREKVKAKKFETREMFIRDVSLLVQNSEQYNGAKSVLTDTAKKMLDLCLQRIAEKEERLMKCEKAINPLLDDNDAVAFGYILDMIMESKLKKVEHSYAFMKPVNRKMVKDYYDIIEQPMALETIIKKVSGHKYSSRAEFLYDVRLIKTNSIKYNGETSSYTKTAGLLYEAAEEGIKEHEEMLAQYEEHIKVTQQAALDAAESDSVITGTSLGADSQEAVKQKKPGKRGRKPGSLNRGRGVRFGKTPGRKPRGRGRRGRGRGRYPRIRMTSAWSREDDFVDIEGDAEVSQITAGGMMSNYDVTSQPSELGYDAAQGVGYEMYGQGEDSLAQDLELSPDNSDNDMPKTPGGSDSDMDDAGNEVQALLGYGDSSTTERQYDASQYEYPEVSMDTDMDTTNQGAGTFDPDKFFESWQKSLEKDSSKARGDASQFVQQGAAADLQLSESDSDQDFEEVS